MTTNAIDRLAAGRGRVRCAPPRSRGESAGRRSFTIRWLVTHESFTCVWHDGPRGPEDHARGEWHSPHYSTARYSRPRPTRVARRRQQEPFRITRMRRNPLRSRRETPPGNGPRQRVGVPRERSWRPDRRGQAPKGAGGMPRRHQIRAWKAAISPGELPNERRSRDTRATQGTETSQYLEEKKSTETPSVAASERGPAQTGWDTIRGRGAGVVEWTEPSRSPLENGTRAGDSPVGQGPVLLSGTQVGSGT